MIEITRDNYELFAIDYVEGNLPMDTLIQFEAFLSNNPDIEEELRNLPDFDLPSAKKMTSNESLSLKKGAMLSEDINEDNCDFYFAAYHEGDLLQGEKESVDHFLIAFPNKKDDFKQVALLNFIADKDIQFPLKSSIKKAVPLTTFQLFTRIAAVFILLLSVALAFLLPRNETQVYTQRDSKIEFPKEKALRYIPTFEEEKTSGHSGTENIEIAVAHDDSPSSGHSEAENVEVAVAVVQEDLNSGTEELGKPEGIADNTEKTIPPEKVPWYNSRSSNHSGTELEDLADNNVISTAPEENDQNILRIKRPFKKKNKDDELLASNDNETIMKVGNPMKNIRDKSIKIGPFRIKR